MADNNNVQAFEDSKDISLDLDDITNKNNTNILKEEEIKPKIEDSEMENKSDDNKEIKDKIPQEFNGGEVEKDKKEVPAEVKYKKVIDRVIEQSGYNTYNLRIFIILALFFLADGGEMVVISLIVNELETQWDLSATQKGFVGSAVFIGFYFGALIGGKMSDSKGRKPTFLLGALIVFIFGLISAFSPSYWFLVVMRCIFGVGVGIAVPSSTSLLAELTPFKIRSCVLTMVWFSFPFGEILAVVFAKNVLVYEEGWRYLLFLVAVPAVLSMLISGFMIESPRYYYAKGKYDKASDSLDKILESLGKPKLTAEERMELANQGNQERGKRINPLEPIENEERAIENIHELSARINELGEQIYKQDNIQELNNKKEENDVREVKDIPQPQEPQVKIIEDKDKNDAVVVRKNSEARKKPTFFTLCNKKNRCLTFSIAYIFFTASFVYYGIVYILPQNLNFIATREDVKDYILNITSSNNTLNMSLLKDYAPSYNYSDGITTESDDLIEELALNKTFVKTVLPENKDEEGQVLNGLFLSIIFEIPSNIFAILLANHPKLGRIKSMALGFLVTLVFATFCTIFIDFIFIFAAILKFSVNIPFAIIYIYTCEAYPTDIRSMAIGFSNSFNRLAGIMTPIFSQLFFSIKPYFPYISYTIFSLIAVITSLNLPFETLGKKLEDH